MTSTGESEGEVIEVGVSIGFIDLSIDNGGDHYASEILTTEEARRLIHDLEAAIQKIEGAHSE